MTTTATNTDSLTKVVMVDDTTNSTCSMANINILGGKLVSSMSGTSICISKLPYNCRYIGAMLVGTDHNTVSFHTNITTCTTHVVRIHHGITFRQYELLHMMAPAVPYVSHIRHI
jgi:hypothetical protein